MGREIKSTGYSCHVGRETSAWFLICDLGIDWRMGAEWFESVLIDYEPAANWFCWVFVCLIRATGGNGFREIGQPELQPCTRLQTVEIVFLSAQHDPDGSYIKRWVPELRCLPEGLPVREPWRSFEDPAMAVSSNPRGGNSTFGPGPDRIQMARRMLTKGGPSVAVWWNCSRTARRQASEDRKWPPAYPMPIFPPSSFYDIEKVADKARRQQRQKKVRMDALRSALQRLGSAIGGACYELDTIEDNAYDESDGSEEGVDSKASKRWKPHGSSECNSKSSKLSQSHTQVGPLEGSGNSYYGGIQTWANQVNECNEKASFYTSADVPSKTRRWGKARSDVS